VPGCAVARESLRVSSGVLRILRSSCKVQNCTVFRYYLWCITAKLGQTYVTRGGDMGCGNEVIPALQPDLAKTTVTPTSIVFYEESIMLID
jgi:hypothetical protein